MSLRFVAALMFSFVCFAVPAWADLQAGLDASDLGDYATAVREWQPLAEQGDVQAQALLGLLYFDGRGVPQDYIHAHKWYNLGAANGEKLGVEARDILAKQMMSAQIAEAQQLTREWKANSK